MVACTFLTASASLAADEKSADEFTSTPLVVTVENQPAIETIRQCVAAVEKKTARNWSLWVDRQLDPSTTIDLAAQGPTAASVLGTVAEKTGWGIFPVEAVLLVGRPDWIDAMLASGLDSKSSRPDRVSVDWPANTPARTVFQLVLLDEPTGDIERDETWIPHDVWVAGELRDIDRRVALSLLLGQFNRRLPATASLAMIDLKSTNVPNVLEPLIDVNRKPPSIALPYPSGPTSELIREEIRKHDAKSRVRVDGGQLNILAVPTAHRHAMQAHWKKWSPPQGAGGNSTQTFDLKLVNKPAVEVIRHLAKAAGKKVRVEPEATQQSERLISLDGKTKTLQQLVELVAQSAELQVMWLDAEVVISLPKNTSIEEQ